jgi:hypothetical protein
VRELQWFAWSLFLVVACMIVSAIAEDTASDRARAALPALVEQRNNAMDAAALCQGDVALLKQQLADAKAELEKLKATAPK